MKRAYVVFIVSFLAFSFVSSAGRAADTLNDKSIRALLDEYAATIKSQDASKVMRYLDNMLDEKYTIQTNAMVTGGANAPPRSVNTTLDKAHVIAAVLNSFGTVKIESYDVKATEIKYSDDRKTAYVNTDVSMATTNSASTAAAVTMMAHVQENLACSNTLVAADSGIKLTKSVCNGKILVTK